MLLNLSSEVNRNTVYAKLDKFMTVLLNQSCNKLLLRCVAER